MKAAVFREPGTPLTIETIADPTPAVGEAIIQVHHCGVCGTDLHAFAGKQPFFSYPRILGHELGVEVIDPGSEPHGLKAGDRCSVEPYLNCGHCIACRRGKPNCCTSLNVIGVHSDGGMRPFFALPARKLHRSALLDYEQLALVETLGIGAHASKPFLPSPGPLTWASVKNKFFTSILTPTEPAAGLVTRRVKLLGDLPDEVPPMLQPLLPEGRIRR